MAYVFFSWPNCVAPSHYMFYMRPWWKKTTTSDSCILYTGKHISLVTSIYPDIRVPNHGSSHPSFNRYYLSRINIEFIHYRAELIGWLDNGYFHAEVSYWWRNGNIKTSHWDSWGYRTIFLGWVVFPVFQNQWNTFYLYNVMFTSIWCGRSLAELTSGIDKCSCMHVTAKFETEALVSPTPRRWQWTMINSYHLHDFDRWYSQFIFTRIHWCMYYMSWK